MRPGGQLSRLHVERIAEAAGSWLLLNEIWQRFGDQDGAASRDMRAAEDRLKDAIAGIEWR